MEALSAPELGAGLSARAGVKGVTLTARPT